MMAAGLRPLAPIVGGAPRNTNTGPKFPSGANESNMNPTAKVMVIKQG
jgi:hypothetical protein